MKRNLWIALSVLAILALVYFVTSKDEVKVGVKTLTMPSFQADAVDKVVFSGNQNITLIKDQNHWVVLRKTDDKEEKLTADDSRVKELLEALLALKSSYYVTNLAEKYDSLQLSDGKALKLELMGSDKPLWSILIGKNADTGGRYVKLVDKDEVFAAKADFFSISRPGIDDWRDRNIAGISPSKISSVVTKKNGNTILSVAKEGTDDDAKWVISQDQPGLGSDFRTNDESVHSFVRTATNLKAMSFIDKPEDLKVVLMTLDVKSSDGEPIHMTVYEGREGKILIKNESTQKVFEVAKNAYDTLTRNLEGIRNLSFMEFDPKKVVKLTFTTKNGPAIVEKSAEGFKLIHPKSLPKDYEFDPALVEVHLDTIANLKATRLANNKTDVVQNKDFANSYIAEIVDDAGKKIYLRGSMLKKGGDEYVLMGNIDAHKYFLKNPQISKFMTLDVFKKQNFEMPNLEGAPGFESLPVDVQRKLLDHAKTLQKDKAGK